jgi:type I restriction enzyme S subunit
MSKIIEIIEKPISGEWGDEDESAIGIPVLRTTNFTNTGEIDYSNLATRIVDQNKAMKKFLQAGDLIIEKSGGSPAQPVGRVVYFEGENNKYLFNNFTSVLRIKNAEKHFYKYFFYQLYYKYKMGVTRKFQNNTTGISNLKLDRFVNEIEVTFPSIRVQKQITKTLDTTAELLAMRKQQFAELDNHIKSTFYDMFGDLAFNDCKWGTSELVNICENKDDIKCGPFGTQLSKDEYQDSGVPLWGIPQINTAFKMPTKEFLTFEKARILDAYSIIPNDIAMSRKGNVGKCALYPTNYSPGIMHSDVLRIRINQETVNPIFMLHQFHLSGFIQNQIKLVSGGAIMAGVNVTKLKHILVHVPSIPLQNKFAEIVAKIEEQKVLVKQAIDETQMLFDSLMSQYFEK